MKLQHILHIMQIAQNQEVGPHAGNPFCTEKKKSKTVKKKNKDIINTDKLHKRKQIRLRADSNSLAYLKKKSTNPSDIDQI